VHERKIRQKLPWNEAKMDGKTSNESDEQSNFDLKRGHLLKKMHFGAH
jgi:hypothetical protein